MQPTSRRHAEIAEVGPRWEIGVSPAPPGCTRARSQRVDQHTGRVTYRMTTERKRLFAANRGFVTVNDAPAMASQLARYLIATHSDYEDRYRTNFDSIPTMIPNMIVRKIEPSSSHRRRPVDLPVDASISVVGNIL